MSIEVALVLTYTEKVAFIHGKEDDAVVYLDCDWLNDSRSTKDDFFLCEDSYPVVSESPVSGK